MKGIVFENKTFIVREFEENDPPVNLTLQGLGQYPKDRFTMLNGIDAYVHRPWGNGSAKPLTIDFNYKGVTIDSRRYGDDLSVADLLNKYYNLSENQIDAIYEKALKDIKTDLEKEVEDLKLKKDELKDFLKQKFTQLDELKDELEKKINELKS